YLRLHCGPNQNVREGDDDAGAWMRCERRSSTTNLKTLPPHVGNRGGRRPSQKRLGLSHPHRCLSLTGACAPARRPGGHGGGTEPHAPRSAPLLPLAPRPRSRGWVAPLPFPREGRNLAVRAQYPWLILSTATGPNQSKNQAAGLTGQKPWKPSII